MSVTKEEILNEAFDAGLVTLGAVGVGFATKRVVKDGLGVPTTPVGVFKLALAITGGSLLVQYLQKKKLLPDDPVKTATS